MENTNIACNKLSKTLPILYKDTSIFYSDSVSSLCNVIFIIIAQYLYHSFEANKNKKEQ